MALALPGPAHAPAADSDAVPAGEPLLDAERLDCYRVARDFYALACSFPLRAEGELRDQLRRGALSILLNTAEGAGRRSAADKARFFAMARGSAMECAALLDVIGLRGLVPFADCSRGRSHLVRLVQMLTGLQRSSSRADSSSWEIR